MHRPYSHLDRVKLLFLEALAEKQGLVVFSMLLKVMMMIMNMKMLQEKIGTIHDDDSDDDAADDDDDHVGVMMVTSTMMHLEI